MTLLTMNGADGQTTRVSLELFNLKRWLEMAPNCMGDSASCIGSSPRRSMSNRSGFIASADLVSPSSSGLVASTSSHTSRFGTRRPALPGQRKATPRFTGARPRKRRLN